MKSVLWSLVVAFQVVVQEAIQIPVQPNFDLTKFSGKWYALGVVKNSRFRKPNLVQEIQWVKVENGGVAIVKQLPEKNCKKIKVMLKASGQPGKFELASDKNSVYRVMETDYDNYGIVHVHWQYSRFILDFFMTYNDYVLFLYSRKPELSDSMKEKFQFVANAVQLSGYKIVYFSDSGKCP